MVVCSIFFLFVFVIYIFFCGFILSLFRDGVSALWGLWRRGLYIFKCLAKMKGSLVVFRTRTHTHPSTNEWKMTLRETDDVWEGWRGAGDSLVLFLLFSFRSPCFASSEVEWLIPACHTATEKQWETNEHQENVKRLLLKKFSWEHFQPKMTFVSLLTHPYVTPHQNSNQSIEQI